MNEGLGFRSRGEVTIVGLIVVTCNYKPLATMSHDPLGSGSKLKPQRPFNLHKANDPLKEQQIGLRRVPLNGSHYNTT